MKFEESKCHKHLEKLFGRPTFLAIPEHTKSMLRMVFIAGYTCGLTTDDKDKPNEIALCMLEASK